MNKKPVFTSRFKKDYKRILKQGKDESKFEALIAKLINNETLEDKYKDHKLSGQFKNCREAALAPFRKFRHVFFHGYGFHIEWDRMQEGVATVDEVLGRFKARLHEWRETLESK
jgi:mRNA interferase YafQ